MLLVFLKNLILDLILVFFIFNMKFEGDGDLVELKLKFVMFDLELFIIIVCDGGFFKYLFDMFFLFLKKLI